MQQADVSGAVTAQCDHERRIQQDLARVVHRPWLRPLSIPAVAAAPDVERRTVLSIWWR
ncbi:hypothetical protein [Streptomyces cellulosae]|uniref:Uncharacterized protein n=1 Tax=Streptomyces cellulosae TaxID=1968 RepID=A0ABW7YG74_STRCE